MRVYVCSRGKIEKHTVTVDEVIFVFLPFTPPPPILCADKYNILICNM